MKNHSAFENIRALRGVAVLLVVLRHALIFTDRALGGETSFLRQLFLTSDAGVDLFFAISGFVLVMSTRSERSRRAFLYKRITRIYPLYWFYTLLILAIYLSRPGLLYRLQRGVSVGVIESFLLWPQAGWPLLGQAWSLVYEMYFYLVFAGLMRLSATGLSRALLGWSVLVAILWGWTQSGLPGGAHPLMQTAASPLTLDFIGGALAALALERRWRIGSFGSFLGRAGAALGVAALMAAVDHGGGLRGWMRLAGYGLPSVALVAGATILEREFGQSLPVALRKIGDWSYSIFLSHIFVVAALGVIWPWRAANTNLNAALLESAMVGLSVAAGALSYRWLERPLLSLTRRWMPRNFSEDPLDAVALPRRTVMAS